jgi:hypothetical protein
MRHQGLGDLAAVVGLALGGGDLAQRGAGFLEHEALARLGRAAARHEGLGEAGQVFQQRHLQAPLVGGDAAHAVAALGQFDGGLHQVAERQLAETLWTAPPSRPRRRGW